MNDAMPKEQENYLRDLTNFMGEATNMNADEAYNFAFRCWQFKNNGKFKELVFGESKDVRTRFEKLMSLEENKEFSDKTFDYILRNCSIQEDNIEKLVLCKDVACAGCIFAPYLFDCAIKMRNYLCEVEE